MRASPQPAESPRWASITTWLTPRRLRAQAIVLALCLWTVCAVDFSTPGFFDRAANIKFQDFLPLYVSARLITQNRAGALYDQQAVSDETEAMIRQMNAGQPTRVRLSNLYGPQVGLLFVPLAHLSFAAAARVWVTFSLLIFFACIYAVWKSCPALRPHAGFVTLSALAFPPLFHFFVRAQISVLPLACFTAAFLAFRAKYNVLGGIALGLLMFKPQFLIAIPFVLLLSPAGKALAGLTLSAAAQLLFTKMYFGPAVMRAYFDTLWHTSRWIDVSELDLAPIQMHSLRSFWTLLIPWPEAAFVVYVLSSGLVIVIAAAIFRSPHSLALRFSGLTIAAVLVNPHLFVYDLLVLAPVLLLLAGWTLTHAPSDPKLCLLLYLTFVLPLFGPLSRWIHLQLSVPTFVVLLWVLWRLTATPGHKLDSVEAHVV